MKEIIEIKLPESSVEDMEPKECHICGNSMIAGLSNNMYTYKGRKFRIRRMRVWKCIKCGEEIMTFAEVDRVTNAVYKKAEELDG